MEGEVFPDKNPYHLSNLSKMHARCSECNQNYEPEPNFYYGAMYVSYAYTVALFVAVYLLFHVILEIELWTTVGILAGFLVVLGPLLFRLARITWLNIFVHYDANAQIEWEEVKKSSKKKD